MQVQMHRLVPEWAKKGHYILLGHEIDESRWSGCCILQKVNESL